MSQSVDLSEILDAYAAKDALRLYKAIKAAERQYEQNLEAANPGVKFYAHFDMNALEEGRRMSLFKITAVYETEL